MNSSLRLISLLICIVANFPRIEVKEYTVCELADELYNNHSVPRENVYRHLCIIGEFMHTDYSGSGFHGLYRIGEQWLDCF
jgi:type VI protein secretion system component VasF